MTMVMIRTSSNVLSIICLSFILFAARSVVPFGQFELLENSRFSKLQRHDFRYVKNIK